MPLRFFASDEKLIEQKWTDEDVCGIFGSSYFKNTPLKLFVVLCINQKIKQH